MRPEQGDPAEAVGKSEGEVIRTKPSTFTARR